MLGRKSTRHYGKANLGAKGSGTEGGHMSGLIREWVKVRLCVWLLSSAIFTPFGVLFTIFHISATIEVVLLFACLLVFKTVSHYNAQSSLEFERPG